MIHLVDESPVTTTLCGRPIEEVAEIEWTDAIVEILEMHPRDRARDGVAVCGRCATRGREILAQWRRDDAAHGAEAGREVALEAGMLHGIDAYNDAIGSPTGGRDMEGRGPY